MQVFTSDDHYNLRVRARPVDYSLTRRSFEIDFEDFPVAVSYGRSDPPSPVKHEAPPAAPGSPGDPNLKAPLDPAEDGAGLEWHDYNRASGGARLKHNTDRVPVKTEGLHPAFHKHLLSQVHHHSSKSNTEGIEHNRLPASHSKPSMEKEVFGELHDQEEESKKDTHGGSFDSHGTEPSPTEGGLGMGMEFLTRGRERNFSEGSQQSAVSSARSPGKLASQSSYEEGQIDISTHVVEYPSQFPGLKERISIKNEMILVTKLCGVNIKTGSNVALYKCHMCNKMYNRMSKLQCHMSMHFEHSMSIYSCDLCGATFKFRLQLTRHATRVHRVKPFAPTTRHRFHSQSSALAPGKGSTVTSPEDYKTR